MLCGVSCGGICLQKQYFCLQKGPHAGAVLPCIFHIIDFLKIEFVILYLQSKKMSRYPNDCKVYVGDLGNSARKNELEDAFSYYGPLRNVWIARNPPGFAFVEFEDTRDAEDAVRGLDGRTVCGRRARVELSNGKSGRGFRGPPSRSRGRPFHPDDRCYECGDRGHYARDCRKHGKSSRRR